MGWSVSEFQSRFNPRNIDALLSYSGSVNPNISIPGKRVSFSDVVNGITAYAHLLISGYKHVAWAYGNDLNNLSNAVTGLSVGYVTGYNGGSATYGSTVSYALNSSSTKRMWATAGYSGMYSTILNNLSTRTYVVNTSESLPGFSDITFNP